MLEIVLLFAVFCIGVVGVGFLSTRDIYRQVNKTVNKMKRLGNREARGVKVRESQDVDTAAINPNTGNLLVDPYAIKEETEGAGQAIYNSIRDDARLLAEIGLDKAQTYKEAIANIKDSTIYSTVTHEIGHMLSKADEVGAELYRSAVKGYGELTAKDKLDYTVSLYNLIKKGGEEGYKTAQKTYDVIRKYGGEPIKDIVNAMLNSDEKLVGKSTHKLNI